MTPTLVFDIETIPDVAGLRALYELEPTLPDADVAEIAFQRRRAAVGHDFLPVHQHRVVAISCVLREGDSLKVWSLGTPEDDEGQLIQRFYDGIEKFNNYISRYHTRHIDLMDLLALYQPRNNAPLDELARLTGLPGKLGMDGSQVWDAFRAGRIADIRNYCETDVVNTWLVFLRFQKMRGVLRPNQHAREIELVRATLARLGEPHWREFLAAWQAAE
jgi:predicted PolB exonuclease-like 3'-5' exonuclease